jgi:hypothetical protein
MVLRRTPAQAGRSQSMPTDFSHVANLLLRRVLETRPEQLRVPDIEQAVSWTLDALGRDAIREDLAAIVFEARRAAAKQATVLMRRHRKTQAHRALQRFWLR